MKNFSALINWIHRITAIAAVFCDVSVCADDVFSYYFQPDPEKDAAPASAPYKISYHGGSLRFFRRAERTVFRYSKEVFDAGNAVVEVTAADSFRKPLKAWLYVTDKDGAWYQSEKEFSIEPGKTTRLSVPLSSAGRHWLPNGHSAAWSGLIRAGIFEAGVTIWAEEPGEGELSFSEVRFEGAAPKKAPLTVRNWKLPSECRLYESLESRFELSREYFNPYDPDEIEVNFLVWYPGWKERCAQCTSIEPVLDQLFPYRLFDKDWLENLLDRTKEPDSPSYLSYPAFYSQDYERTMRMTHETVLPVGMPFWAFRFFPPVTGEIRIALEVIDKTGEKPETIVTPWRKITVKPSDLPGAIHVSKRDPRYFEFSNGKFFFPVSINIHANTDHRSEDLFQWGILPDRGTQDYEDYFNGCGKNGITMAEVWMASWTCAIEWDAARRDYYGTGRYSLANAWRLDRIFDCARANGIYLNLVLDSHGKMCRGGDQEWEDHPYNAKGVFNIPNGGFMQSADDFWTSFQAMEADAKRNRYIAARWGAEPHIFAIEFWSEVDLVQGGRRHYDRGASRFWHTRAVRNLKPQMQAPTLYTTHVCGVGQSTLHYRDVCIDIPDFTHIVSDAYRSPAVHFADQVYLHKQILGFARKPMVITEFGGTSGGSEHDNLRGDIHCALWASFMTGQAGSPALWWHDFVHFCGMYPHYKIFADFIEGIDLLKDTPEYCWEAVSMWMPREPSPAGKAIVLSETEALVRQLTASFEYWFNVMPFPGYVRCAGLKAGKDAFYAWIFRMEETRVLPQDISGFRPMSGVVISIPALEPGIYALGFTDPLTGNAVIPAQKIRLDGTPKKLVVPPFRTDIALKLRRMNP